MDSHTLGKNLKALKADQNLHRTFLVTGAQYDKLV